MDRFLEVDTEHLRRLRRRAAFSQKELAERAGTTQETISRLERGHHSARGSTLRRLAEALGVEPHELMKGEDDA
jgi:transcriptional regulator with XRE-family HTH domain